MAKILYAVHGTGHGHAMRGLTIARGMPEHEFLFVGGDDAPEVLEPEFRLERIPNLGTVFKNYKVDFGATISRALPLLLQREKHIAHVQGLIDSFKPDICITDLEYFTPRAAERAGIPCLTLDHQHVITLCEHDLLPDMSADFFIQGLTPKYLFRPTDHNLLISFYQPPLLPKWRDKAIIMPPILRRKVLELEPHDEGHIVVYQSNSTHSALIDFLRAATSRICHVFGYRDEESRTGNVFFHKKDEEGFLRLLEGCSYVIQGGSHTLMGEALYLGKPVLALPLYSMIEQRVNAMYLERLGYGMQARITGLEPAMLERFEENLPQYRKNIFCREFCSNKTVFALVSEFAASGCLGNLKRPD